MKKALLAILVSFAFVALPASAVRNTYAEIMDTVEVATGTPVSVTISNVEKGAGLLVVKTENETATASMVTTVYNVTPLGDVLVCTMSAITTETTTTAYIGHSYASASEGIDDVCPFALGINVKFTFTTSGVGADFDVSAGMLWLEIGG